MPFNGPAGTPAPVITPGRTRISPAARQRAGELGVDLAGLTGTGPGGAVTLDDVARAAQAAKLQPPTAAERHAAMRQAIGAAMARSKREIPHYYLGTTIDMSQAMAWLQTENARHPRR